MAEYDVQNPKFYLQFLSTLNKLTSKAYEAENSQALIFIILNDTFHLMKYERAILWDMESATPKLLGISGFAKVDHRSEAVERWKALLESLKEPSKAQLLDADKFPGNQDLFHEVQKNLRHPTMMWIPIRSQQKTLLGLWLEGCQKEDPNVSFDDLLTLMDHFLAPPYAGAWRKFAPKLAGRSAKRLIYHLGAIVLGASLFFMPFPLRVVAPCQVVPKDPYVVTAPLEGIIESVVARPGQQVAKGMPLIEYDKKVPFQELKAAQKQVEMIQTELNRSRTLGLKDDKALLELSLLSLKLDREKINLDLLQYNAGLLSVKSPEDGVVMIDDPDDWRGKPVKVGEKILTVSDPNQSKIRIWIPEHDNVLLDPEKQIKIFLNVIPEQSFEAKLDYVANESTISEKHVPSFIAEANWIGEAPDVHLGVKGTAILYGKDVTLFYYLIRRPLNYFRELIGV